jgi:hypothetical protein
MSTRIEYRNTLGSIVTEQQKSNLSQHYKLVYDLATNKLKTKLYYFGDEIINEGVYYMDSSENINTVIAQLNPSHRWSIMSDLQVVNGYNVWKENYFQDGELDDVYSKQVFNAAGDSIAEFMYDANGQPTRGGGKRFDLSNKNMIDADGDIIGKFEEGDWVGFYFDSDGSFTADSSDNHIFFKPYITLQSFLDSQHNGYVMNLMTQAMKDYYLNFQPLVPPFQI